MSELDTLRKEIDRIDEEMIRLFEERMAVCEKVGAYKRERGLPVFDGVREQQVVFDRVSKVKNPRYADYLERMIRTVMDLSKELQAKEQRPIGKHSGKVAFQGTAGAYSEEALHRYFGKTDTLSVAQFEDVFRAVIMGEADYGVVPVENSAAGSVTQNYDLLGRYGVWVAGEIALPVCHALLGAKGATIETVREVYSHEQALRQCDMFLKQHSDWEIFSRSNTAESAKWVAAQNDPKKAAIASAFAGEMYGLTVLQDGITNTRNNETRFFIIARQQEGPIEGRCKASLTFTLAHKQGTLACVLEILSRMQYNLTKIESRPILGQRWQYRFYVDLEGDAAGLSALEQEMREITMDYRLMGAYLPAGQEAQGE